MAAEAQSVGVAAQRVEAISARHLRPLDGLRGLAILLVVVYHFGLLHAGFSRGEVNPLGELAQLGWIGVDLFFVLSGFLITGILLDSRERPNYFTNFLGRRFLRIWPLYYLNLVLFFWIAPAFLANEPAELQSMQEHQSWFWLYAANWMFARQGGFEQTSGGYFWSLAVEEQFYIVWPLIVFWMSAMSLRRLCIILFVVSVGARFLLVGTGVSTNAAYTMTFSHMDGLVVGAFLAASLRTGAAVPTVDRWLPWLGLAGLVAVAVSRLIDHSYVFWGRAMVTAGIAGGALAFGWMLWTMVRRSEVPFASRLFNNGFVVATGRYSYALYLAHVPAGYVVHALFERKGIDASGGSGYWLFFGVAFVLSWGLAAASWHLFEKHVLKLKRYFA